ncbi:hypothetical protein HDU76_003827, partial [Blyttiomyces sp. JEL0837]
DPLDDRKFGDMEQKLPEHGEGSGRASEPLDISTNQEPHNANTSSADDQATSTGKQGLTDSPDPEVIAALSPPSTSATPSRNLSPSPPPTSSDTGTSSHFKLKGKDFTKLRPVSAVSVTDASVKETSLSTKLDAIAKLRKETSSSNGSSVTSPRHSTSSRNDQEYDSGSRRASHSRISPISTSISSRMDKSQSPTQGSPVSQRRASHQVISPRNRLSSFSAATPSERPPLVGQRRNTNTRESSSMLRQAIGAANMMHNTERDADVFVSDALTSTSSFGQKNDSLAEVSTSVINSTSNITRSGNIPSHHVRKSSIKIGGISTSRRPSLSATHASFAPLAEIVKFTQGDLASAGTAIGSAPSTVPFVPSFTEKDTVPEVSEFSSAVTMPTISSKSTDVGPSTLAATEIDVVPIKSEDKVGYGDGQSELGNMSGDTQDNFRSAYITPDEFTVLGCFDEDADTTPVKLSVDHKLRRAAESSMRSLESSKTGNSSMATFGTGQWPHSRELSETFGIKMRHLGTILSVILLNTALIIVAYLMTHGLKVNLPPEIIAYAGGVTVELVLLVTNACTTFAMDLGACIYFAGLLTHKKGYSMAVCGFMQTPPILRVSFTNQLSLNSSCRKTLHRAAVVWFLVELVKALSPIGATGVLSQTVRAIASPVNCIIFESVKRTDRKFPTVNSTSGGAEFLYGSSLGCMRSEAECPEVKDGSQFVFGPQLDDSVDSGDTILGNGFQAIIRATCECASLDGSDAIENDQLMTPLDIQAAHTALTNSSKVPFILMSSRHELQNPSSTYNSEFPGYYQFNMVLGNVNYCAAQSSSRVIACTVNVTDLADVLVSSAFESDGHAASVILTHTEAVSLLDTQLITPQAGYEAMTAMLPPQTPVYLPSTVPGILNPLLWWTSAELMAVNPSHLDQGAETMVALLLRSGIQRTFRSKGTTCNRQVWRTDQTKVFLNGWGAATVFLSAMFQLFTSLLSLAFATTWLFLNKPILPAMRVVEDPSFFMALLTDSPFTFNLIGTAYAPKHVIWQSLDTVVRVGESVDSLELPVGRVKIERPRLVRPFTNGRMYA